jgi:hypothetical protein
MIGNTSERQRELWVHLEVLVNECRNHTQTLRDAWVRINSCLEAYRWYLRLPECPGAIDFPQRQI